MNEPREPDVQFKVPTGTRFADMTPRRKWIFAAKIAACILTFGFAFPHAQFE
jgi:hypothetical protein